MRVFGLAEAKVKKIKTSSTKQKINVKLYLAGARATSPRTALFFVFCHIESINFDLH